MRKGWQASLSLLGFFFLFHLDLGYRANQVPAKWASTDTFFETWGSTRSWEGSSFKLWWVLRVEYYIYNTPGFSATSNHSVDNICSTTPSSRVRYRHEVYYRSFCGGLAPYSRLVLLSFSSGICHRGRNSIILDATATGVSAARTFSLRSASLRILGLIRCGRSGYSFRLIALVIWNIWYLSNLLCIRLANWAKIMAPLGVHCISGFVTLFPCPSNMEKLLIFYLGFRYLPLHTQLSQHLYSTYPLCTIATPIERLFSPTDLEPSSKPSDWWNLGIFSPCVLVGQQGVSILWLRHQPTPGMARIKERSKLSLVIDWAYFGIRPINGKHIWELLNPRTIRATRGIIFPWTSTKTHRDLLCTTPVPHGLVDRDRRG